MAKAKEKKRADRQEENYLSIETFRMLQKCL